jgi:hypothetical protein
LADELENWKAKHSVLEKAFWMAMLMEMSTEIDWAPDLEIWKGSH